MANWPSRARPCSTAPTPFSCRTAAPDAFVRAGLSAAQVIVTGLCVEPALVPLAAPAMTARIARLDAHGPLTGGFFSSGAEPRLDVQTLVAAAQDVTRNGGRAILVARRGGSVHRLAMSTGAHSAHFALFETRAELEAVTAACFASLDYVVAPTHERSHWALGLGLPLFALEPAIGSFAPPQPRAPAGGGASPSPLRGLHAAHSARACATCSRTESWRAWPNAAALRHPGLCARGPGGSQPLVIPLPWRGFAFSHCLRILCFGSG